MRCYRGEIIMKKIIMSLSLITSLSLTGYVFASTNIGDPASGKNKISECVACHTETGISIVSSYPHLAGQNARYLAKQIADIQSGSRNVPEMMPFVGDLSSQDITDIAAYYASQTAASGAANPKLATLGKSLYMSGNAKKQMMACAGCHTANGTGNSLAGYPNISGQQADYTAKQLRAFRESERTNDGDAQVMRTIAGKLSNREIDALASYISGLR
ncbi:Cytochrome c4 [invertebrate metagenome]|uniref:Cytochrome c4 n=1 Tax=invertebrate metagenome TaxID=1711999 RepID=A0A2H9T519_9ZZZZ